VDLQKDPKRKRKQKVDMIALLLGILLMALYVALRCDKDEIRLVDVLGLAAILCVAWGTSRYAGTGSKPLWDPN